MLASVAKLAAGVRSALGDTTPKSLQLAAAETFTAGSLEAAHEYSVAQDLQYAGKYDEAIQRYLKAIELDPELGRADSGVAALYANQGRRDEAEKYYKLAMAKIDRMSDREKFRTRGGYYLGVRRDPDKAIEEYTPAGSPLPRRHRRHLEPGARLLLQARHGQGPRRGTTRRRDLSEERSAAKQRRPLCHVCRRLRRRDRRSRTRSSG